MRDEWDALKDRARDCWVLEVLWTAKNGKPIDIHDNHDAETGDIYPEYIPSGKPWKTHGECDAVAVPYFTTDRNACALVLDKIVQQDKGWTYLWHLMEVLLNGEHGLNFEEAGGLDALMAIHIVDPDLICYCALKAVEDVPEE